MRFPLEILQRCWFLAGPTACGKTGVGVELAERIDAEIVSLDSMALYRGMDLGTAKPSAQERRRVPHHLIDVIEPHEEYSVAQYLAAAQNVCGEILARNKTPLFVGGTGLYLRSILRGVFEGPPADRELRRRLEAEARDQGSGVRVQESGFRSQSSDSQHSTLNPQLALHRQLAQVDPASAAALHPHDTRRIIRALEVYELTGVPLSDQQQHPPLPPHERPPNCFWLNPPRDWLHERINRRVEAMIAAGLVEEARRLRASRRPLSRTARQALGYKEIIEHLETGSDPISRCIDGDKAGVSCEMGRDSVSDRGPVSGRPSLEETIERIKARTRQFAKRQYTWFRNLEECRAVPMTGQEAPKMLAGKVAMLNMRG